MRWFWPSQQFPEAASAFKLLGDYADLVSTHEEHDLWVDARERLGLALVSAGQFEDTISILGELLKRGGRSTKNTSLSGIARSFLPKGNDNAKREFVSASAGTDSEPIMEAHCRLGILEFQARRFEIAKGYFGLAV